MPLISQRSHNNPTGFPQVFRTLRLHCLTRGTQVQHLRNCFRREATQALKLRTRLIAPSGSRPQQTEVRMSQKKMRRLPWRRDIGLAHCPFVNACWVRVKIRRVLHYDASSCMKVYFKESLEEGRRPGRRGTEPEEAGLKGKLLY